MKAQCQRCGTCCKKGGPGLHKEDQGLVESGRIPGSALFTLRAGELVRDNVKGILSSLDEEMVKIKGAFGRWTCIFYDESSKGCGIYADRPLECRALNCRDTREIEKVYSCTRLARKDLLSKVVGLWDLIEDHDEHCSYAKIKLLVDEGGANGLLKRESDILEIMRYDAHLRQLTMERVGGEAKISDFLFGRPLSDTIKMFNLRLEKRDGAFRLLFRSS